jgi:hypothetical protein
MDLDELVEHWTLLDDERELAAGKRGPTRLGFALLLKFYAGAGRFPRGRSELAGDAAEFVARQPGVPASDLGFYEWSGHTSEYHRAQVRRHFWFRECSAEDGGKLTDWLAASVCQAERRADRVRRGTAGPVPRRADRAAVRGPLRPDHPLGPAPGRAGAHAAGDSAARPGRQRGSRSWPRPPAMTRPTTGSRRRCR